VLSMWQKRRCCVREDRENERTTGDLERGDCPSLLRQWSNDGEAT
jgi:hypothetical protein